jgi:poly-gamma-glutamate capsule biosynthesis protein CapA/YwtB (metallophosphatase superfamily)
MIKILIGGDVCPRGRNESLFKNGKLDDIYNDLLLEFKEADLSLINLECPLTDIKNPIPKSGPILGAPTECIKGISGAEIDIVNLANNHILDHGYEGLKNTIEVCERHRIEVVGAGENLKSAGEMSIKEINGLRIGILGMAEHEFSIATERSWGANPLSIANFIKVVRKNKDNIDFLITLVHAGAYGYPYPSPKFQELARFFAEVGANVVIFQHSHAPGCYEEYRGAFIVYGQGNFIFDSRKKTKPSFWNEGYLIKISIDEKINSSMEIIPYIQSDVKAGARRMDKNIERKFLEELKRKSQKIKEKEFVQKEWEKYCMDLSDSYYLIMFLGQNKLLNNKYTRFINRKLRLTKFLLSGSHKLLLKNLFSCETHREIIETFIKKELYNQNRKDTI